jgi:hypothetical protein
MTRQEQQLLNLVYEEGRQMKARVEELERLLELLLKGKQECPKSV